MRALPLVVVLPFVIVLVVVVTYTVVTALNQPREIVVRITDGRTVLSTQVVRLDNQ